MDIKVIVAAHKPYNMPSDKMYVPVHVGAQGKEDIGFTRDDSGDNISAKNPSFCELTGLYYAWKNIDCEYIGLAHYRRHFKGKNGALETAEAEKLLTESGVILPKKRKYYIETLYSHYEHTMFVEPLDIAGEIIKEKCPEYSAEFEKLKKRTSAHMFNMFIMPKGMADKYCEWLFGILFELESRVGDKNYDAFHARFYGRVSELLLDVYLNTNGIKGAEVPLLYTEKINWWKKGTGFLKAKFFGKKYDKSF